MKDNQHVSVSIGAISLSSSSAIEFHGQKFTPDEAKGYFQFEMSRCFPVLNAHGGGVHPTVLTKSYQSLLHQNVNREHQIRAYYKKPGKDSSVTDKIIGSVVAVALDSPSGSMKVQKEIDKCSGIVAVGCYAKQADGMSRLLGDHQTGRHTYAVSMEVDYDLATSGFVAKILPGGKPKFDFTPEDILALGWEYVPYENAPEELRSTFSREKNKVTKDWGRRQVGVLMGGLENEVLYSGVAIVWQGAEKTARIDRITASAPVDIAAPFREFADLLKKTVDGKAKL